MAEQSGTRQHPYDVIIAGAGCAGLYCGWRLRRDAGKEVAIFEKKQRVGGRLLSLDLPGIDFRRAELGGMRFIPETQQLVTALLEELRVGSSSLNDTGFEFPDRFRYLRSERFPASEDHAPLHLYKLDRDHGSTPLQVVRWAVFRALEELDLSTAKLPVAHISAVKTRCRRLSAPGATGTLNAREWQLCRDHGRLNGRPLHDLGFWNLLQHYLHSDEFLYVHDGLGYQSLVANWNAAQAVPTILSDFNVSAGSYKTLENGMETLPRTLREQFVAAGGTVETGKKVKAVARCDTPGRLFKVTIETKEDRSLPFEQQDARRGREAQTEEVFARVVILALPKRALKRVDLSAFGQWHRSLFDKVTGHRAFKLFLGFDHAWWRTRSSLERDRMSFDFANGRVTTDFPIRQIYYMSDDQRPGALIMASYSDDRYVDFWDPLVGDPDRGQHLYKPEIIGSRPDLKNHLATTQLVTKARRQLARVHGYVKGEHCHDVDERCLPEPTIAVVHEWRNAWHLWDVHTRPWIDVDEVAQPLGAGTDLFVCGEAYSTEQGWIEGALKSAEITLARLKDVPHPAWLTTLDAAALGGYARQ